MPSFSGRIWEYSQYVPEGITLNGNEYLIHEENGEDIALTNREEYARAIALVPDMFDMLCDCETCLRIISKYNDTHIIPFMIKDIEKLISRVEGTEEETHE